MAFLHFLGRFYAYWSIPVAIIAFEMGLVYKRRGRKWISILWLFSSFFFVVSSLGWVIFGGYEVSDRWIRDFLETP